jgi:hypothetical protein
LEAVAADNWRGLSLFIFQPSRKDTVTKFVSVGLALLTFIFLIYLGAAIWESYSIKTCSDELKTTEEMRTAITDHELDLNESDYRLFIAMFQHNYSVCLARHGIND